MSIELKPFHNEAQVQAAAGVTLRLIVNFRMIDRLEGLLGRGMDELLADVLVPNPPNALIAKFIWAMTREHHAELTLDQIAGFIYSPDYGPAAGGIIGDLLQRAFHIGESLAEGEQRSRPPSGSRGASRASSKSGSRQTSGQKTSGTKRRAHS